MIWSLIWFEISLFFVLTQAYPVTRDRKGQRGMPVKEVNEIFIFLLRAISYKLDLSIFYWLKREGHYKRSIKFYLFVGQQGLQGIKGSIGDQGLPGAPGG